MLTPRTVLWSKAQNVTFFLNVWEDLIRFKTSRVLNLALEIQIKLSESLTCISSLTICLSFFCFHLSLLPSCLFVDMGRTEKGIPFWWKPLECSGRSNQGIRLQGCVPVLFITHACHLWLIIYPLGKPCCYLELF